MDQKTLNDIKIFIAGRLDAGEPLSAVQQAVNETFGTRYTFMEIRILASELDDIDWDAHDPKAQAKKKAEAGKKAGEETAAEAAAPGAESEAAAAEPVSGGATTVEVSKLVRPGAALSGSVKFGSGSSADWYVDQYGRLGLENVKGGEPTETDLREFQEELRKAFSR